MPESFGQAFEWRNEHFLLTVPPYNTVVLIWLWCYNTVELKLSDVPIDYNYKILSYWIYPASACLVFWL